MHDIETELRKEINTIYVLAEISQRSINNLCKNDDTTLNATENEHMPTQCRKRAEKTDEEVKKNEGQTEPANHAPIKCFYKQNKKSRKEKS